MGKKSQLRREKKSIESAERRLILRKLEESKSPWLNFWKRIDFWIYTLCLIAIIAFPFFKPQAFSNQTTAIIHTSMGDIRVALYDKDAPKTVKNFTALAGRGYYNNQTWHRVIKGFMIQSGDPKGDGTGGESADGGTFADEINADSLGLGEMTVGQDSYVSGQLSSDDQKKYADYTVKNYYEQVKGYHYITKVFSHKMEVGSLAMANYGPDTNGSQFFIVTEKAQPHLDGQHTVFGQVIEGLDIAQKISEVSVDDKDKPIDPVYIRSIEIINN